MKKNRLFGLIIFILCIFSIGTIEVKAACSGDSCTPDVWDKNIGGGGSGGSTGGKCFTNSLCGNSDHITMQVDFAHMSNSGDQVLGTVYFTNDPSIANNTTTIYLPGMTKEAYDYGGAADYVTSLLSANNAEYTKQILTNLGVTDFSGIHGTDAFGAKVQPLVDYMTSNGTINTITMKEYAMIATNKSRLLDFLTRVTTGTDDILKYVQGMTPDQCKAAGLAVAASANSGCGMNIIDLACLLGFQINKQPPSCPGGSMVKSGSIGDCYVDDEKNGNEFGFSNTAAGGGRSNVHRVYGEEKVGVGTYCAIYCQEFGTAILPGETGEAYTLGSYIIWPTSEENHNNTKFKKDYYPLKFTGRLSCKMGIRPDSNLPGSNGACFDDPVTTYRENYQILLANYNVPDYSGLKYEKIRFDYTKIDPDMCEGNYNELGGPTSCAKATASGTFAGCKTKKIYPCEQYIDRALPGEVQCEQELLQKYQAAQQAYAAAPASCPTQHCSGTQTVTQNQVCWTEDPCPARKEALRAAMEAARRAWENQKNLVQKLENTLNTIKANKQVCKKYTKAFKDNRTILHHMHICGKYQISADVYDFSSSVTMSWSDKEYNTGNVEKIDSGKWVSQQGELVYIQDGETIWDWNVMMPLTPDWLMGQVNRIKANNYEITAEDTYSLNTNYKFINKSTLAYKKSASGLTNYVNITAEENSVKSVIPTSYNNDIDKNYYLELHGITFGSSMSNFGGGSDYVCKQKFTKTADTCVCPENTRHPGKELSGLICDNNETCADAQAKYCDLGTIPDVAACDAYCDPPMVNVSIAPCINAGYTRDYCKKTICPNIGGPIKCKNSNGVGGKMDITACVETKMAQGKTRQQAIDECDSLICPIGKFIIYRTIKMENPFPGKEISKIADGFNNEVKGRYPGYNWNSKQLVSSKIRNNRGVSGTTIYQEKEPLYTFVINGVTIEKIRDYNKNQKEGYNDFTLECKQNKAAGCISYRFVHNASLSGLVGGTCQNIGLDNGFYTCSK